MLADKAPFTCHQPHSKASFFATTASAAWSDASDLSSDDVAMLGSDLRGQDQGSGRKRKAHVQESLRPRLQLRRSTSSQLSEGMCLAAARSAGAGLPPRHCFLTALPAAQLSWAHRTQKSTRRW